ncbi:toprim domain-containing protein, partial [bacterium]|nr:toprim domain-containing protein [bacterium]
NFHDEVPDDLLKKTNLFLYDENKKQNYLFFNQRIIFPIFDKLNNVIGFSGRDITNLSKAKYINSAESKEFIKGNNLYNYNSLNVIDTNDEIIIVEGYMDTITLVNNDFYNTIATMGTALTSNQLKLIFYLKNLKKIILSFDNDAAGKNAFIKNLNIILEYEKTLNIFVPVYISGLVLTKFKDPDELFKNINKQEAVNVFKKYQNALFMSAKFMLELDNNLEYSLNLVLKYLLKYEAYNFGIYVDNALELLIDYLVNNYSLNKETIQNLIQKLRVNKNPTSYNKTYYKNNFTKIIEYESHDEFDLKIKNKLDNLLINLNKQYDHIILYFLYNPFRAKEFKDLYCEQNIDKNLLNDDLIFRSIIKKINRFKLIDFVSKENYENFLKYGFLLYLYLDNLNLDKFKQNDFEFNLNVLNNSLFFVNLKDDKTFDSANGLRKYLLNYSLNDFKKNEKFFTAIGQESFYKILSKVFNNI